MPASRPRTRSTVLGLLAACALACASPLPARAAWPTDPTQAVALSTGGASDQRSSPGGSISDGAGGAFVVVEATYASGFLGVVVQHVLADGTLAWSGAGTTVCYGNWGMGSPVLVADGAGGVLVAWLDVRASVVQLYGAHLNSLGAPVAGWTTPNGIPLVLGTFNLEAPSACTDGAGGMFVAYQLDFSPTDHDIYVAHTTAGGISSNTGVATQLAFQDGPAIASDAAGGCFVAYSDRSSGNYDIYLSRFNVGLAPVFARQQVTTYSPDEINLRAVPDGTGGVYLAWNSVASASLSHILATRLGPAGTPSSGWGPGAKSVCLNTAGTGILAISSDASGGLFLAWSDLRSLSWAVYGDHLSGVGGAYPGWPQNGLYISSVDSPTSPLVAPDGTGGAIVTWLTMASPQQVKGVRMSPSGTFAPLSSGQGQMIFATPAVGNLDGLVSDGNGGALVFFTGGSGSYAEYAQHVDQYIVRGDARPAITVVKDVPADQGGQVQVRWKPSWLDNTQDYGIGSYWIWRQAPLLVAQQGVARGGAWLDGGAAPAGSQRSFRHAVESAAAYAWEFVASQPANQSALYGFVAPTASDSVAGHTAYTVFMVEAHSAVDPRASWPSAPDSGRSVDNLAPPVPAPFAGTFSAVSGASLTWGESVAPDLRGYRLYRGTTTSFVPGPGNLLIETTAKTLADPSTSPYVYKLSAIDVHGNESGFATLVPTGTLGVDDGTPRTLAFALATANPARGGAAIRLALPQASRVRVAVYDAAGREVRALADGGYAAGEWTLAWDGRDAAGAVAPSGLYFARLTLPGERRTQRIVLMR
jgi:hypothetical protein